MPVHRRNAMLPFKLSNLPTTLTSNSTLDVDTFGSRCETDFWHLFNEFCSTFNVSVQIMSCLMPNQISTVSRLRRAKHGGSGYNLPSTCLPAREVRQWHPCSSLRMRDSNKEKGRPQASLAFKEAWVAWVRLPRLQEIIYKEVHARSTP